MTSKRQMRIRVARLLGYKVRETNPAILDCIKLWALICPDGNYAPIRFKPNKFDLSDNSVVRYIQLREGIDMDKMYTIQK